MTLVENIPETGGWADKGEWQSGWIQVCYIWYIVRLFVMPQHSPTQHNN
jgi:hypothetical protein